jgi:hypothetical protein
MPRLAATASWAAPDEGSAAGRVPISPLRASGSISSPDENITARSSTFSNSRTLPGQA